MLASGAERLFRCLGSVGHRDARGGRLSGGRPARDDDRAPPQRDALRGDDRSWTPTLNDARGRRPAVVPDAGGSNSEASEKLGDQGERYGDERKNYGRSGLGWGIFGTDVECRGEHKVGK